MKKYAVGLDYGTNSCRSVIIDLSDGREIGTHVFSYPTGDNGIVLDPKDPNAAASLANFYRSRKNLEGAESIWTAFLEIQPGNADALLALGGIQAEMSKFEEAKASFQAGLSSGGDVMRFRYQLGRLSALSGMDAEEGIEHLKAYLQTSPAPGSPTWADALWRLGNIYEKTGNKDAAVQAYQKALELNPDHKNAKDSLKALEKK